MYMCTIVAIQIYREINKEYSGLAFCFWNIDSKSAVQLSPSCKGSKNIYTHSQISVNIALSVDMKKASLLPVKVHIGYIYMYDFKGIFRGKSLFASFEQGHPISLQRENCFCSKFQWNVLVLWCYQQFVVCFNLKVSLKAVKSLMHSNSCWLYQFTEEKGH